jgi:hypothetical protein
MTDIEILQRAADIYEAQGDASEPGRMVPGWLRALAVRLAEEQREPTAEEMRAREEYDRLKTL